MMHDQDYQHDMIESLLTGLRNALMNENSDDDSTMDNIDHIAKRLVDKYSNDTESYYHFLNMFLE